VAGDREPGVEHRADHLVRRRGGAVDARHVHHLAERRHAVPLKRGADVVGAEHGARVLEAGQRRHAWGHGEQDPERQRPSLVEHPPDAVEAEHVGDLVVVDQDGRRAVRQDGLGEPLDGHRRGLDVQVGVDQAGDEVGAAGVEDLGLGAARVRGVAEHRDPAGAHRDVDAVEDLARVDVDEPPAGDQQVGGPAAHADVGQRAGEGGERARSGGHGPRA
jgi:hypothetical protein